MLPREPPLKEESVYPDQSVHEMVEEVLQRQAKALADRTGESFELAMRATSKSDAARQLGELARSEYRDLKAAEWQASLLRARAEERHDSWLESYMGWLRGKERRARYHGLLEGEMASLRG